MKRLALIGTKEFSDQIIHFAERTGEFEFVGYFDDVVKKGTIINGYPVFGKVEESIQLYKDGVFDCIFEGIGYTRFDLREYYFTILKGKVPFATIIMPSAIVDSSAVIGEGVFIGEKSYIDSQAVIEDNVFLRLDVTIGHNSIIQSHSYFSGLNCVAGFCNLGKRLFIGTSSIIADGITISDDIWVGMGCCVAQDLTKVAKYMSASMRLIPAPR